MKSLKTVFALLIAATLVGAGAGCKKTPKAPTLIPGQRTTPIDVGNTPTKPVLPTNNVASAVPPGTGLDTGTRVGETGLPVGTTPIDPARAGEQNTRPDPGNFNEDASALAAESVKFDLDRATVKASERPKLDRVAEFMKREATVSLRVEGNCDERGTEDYNRSLGERRALSAREYLVNSGIAPDRITTVTYGEDKPADPGHDEAAWANNRRADFVVLRPKTNIQ